MRTTVECQESVALLMTEGVDLVVTHANELFVEIHRDLFINGIIGRSLIDSHHRSIHQVNAYNYVMGTGQSYLPEKPMEYMKAGETRYYKYAIHPLIRDGATYGTMTVAYDVTDEFARNNSVKTNYELLGSILDSLDIGLFVLEYPAMRVSIANRKICGLISTLSGIDVNESSLKQSSIDELARMTTVSDYTSIIDTVVKTGEIQRFESYRYVINGEEKFAKSVCSPVFNDRGQMTHISILSVDVTELVRLSKSTQEFIHVAAHELKTPLTVLLTNTAVLNRTESKLADEVQTRLRNSIASQSKKLDRIVSDLLEVCKLDLGHLSISLQATELSGYVCRIVTDFCKSCNSHRFRFMSKKRSDLVAEIDQGRLEQVICNLLSNAVRYSAPGSAIDIRLEPSVNIVSISVQDQGCGIPESSLKRIFDRYYRSSSSSGLGLGLYISNEIVKSHGGSIDVQSEEGQGSVFTIKLPRVTA